MHLHAPSVSAFSMLAAFGSSACTPTGDYEVHAPRIRCMHVRMRPQQHLKPLEITCRLRPSAYPPRQAAACTCTHPRATLPRCLQPSDQVHAPRQAITKCMHPGSAGSGACTCKCVYPLTVGPLSADRLIARRSLRKWPGPYPMTVRLTGHRVRT